MRISRYIKSFAQRTPRLTFLFLILMVGIIGGVAGYWVGELEPRLTREARSNVKTLVTAMAGNIVSAMATVGEDGDPAASLEQALNYILLFTDPNTGQPFIIRMVIEWDVEVMAWSEERRTMARGVECPTCMETDVPLFHPRSKELMGIARFFVSDTFHTRLINQVRQHILWVAASYFLLILLVWQAVSVMTGRLDQYAHQLAEANRRLEEKVSDRTRKLSQANERLRSETRKRQELEEASQHLRSELENEERSRLAALLHDGPGQTIMTVLLGLKMFKKQIDGADQATRQAMDNIIRDTGLAIREVRDVTRVLHPLSLEGLPLPEAIGSQCERMARLTGQAIEVEVQELAFTMPEPQKEHLFLVFQEILNNSVKHARAQKIHVTLEQPGKGRLLLTVKDDGCGFDPQGVIAGQGSGYGLSIINERAAALGGALHIRSAPMAGTTIQLEVVIDDPNNISR